jgi:hypothetical protein
MFSKVTNKEFELLNIVKNKIEINGEYCGTKCCLLTNGGTCILYYNGVARLSRDEKKKYRCDLCRCIF